jgi:hypothetical protein
MDEHDLLLGCFNPYPSEKSWSESQLGWWHSQYDGKNVPNHQPDHHHIPIVVGLYPINHY